MTAHEKTIRHGESLYVEGRLQEALDVFVGVLQEDPLNTSALNDAALVLGDLDEPVEAAILLERALKADPSNENAFFNLLDLLRDQGDARMVFEAYEKYGPHIPESDDKAKYRKAFTVHRPAGAVEDHGAPSEPGETPLRVGFVCGPDRKFIGGFVRETARRHHVRTLYFDTRVETAPIQELMDWADVVWFEWCDAVLVTAAQHVRKTAKVVCRLHSYEAFTEMPAQVDWAFVDHVVFVAKHIEEIFRTRFEADVATSVIPNGVDVDALAFSDRPRGFDLAYVGYINHKKNPELLLQCMADLVRRDDRYRLHIAGTFQELRYELYFARMIEAMGLQNHVMFYGWQDDIDAWLEDKSYLVSTSVLESFGMGIAEGMAKGLKPVVHNWVGAEHVLPHEVLFNTVAEFSEMVTADHYAPALYRRFVERHYALPDVARRVGALLSTLGSASARLRTQHDRPDRTLIVTGIPRSGTSLFSVLVNALPNAVCLNEVLYDVEALPAQFAEIRRRLAAGEPIPNKYNSSGKLTTNTQAEDNDVEYRVVEGVDGDAVVGSKINVPYLVQIERLMAQGYKIAAVVRDPVYTIGSWNSAKSDAIPEAHVAEGDVHPRYADVAWASDDKIERQAQLWQELASKVWAWRDRIRIYTYEQVVSETDVVMADLADWLGTDLPAEIPALSDRNDDARYPDLTEIRSAVARLAPLRKVFGYDEAPRLLAPSGDGSGDGAAHASAAPALAVPATPATPETPSAIHLVDEKEADTLLIAFGGIKGGMGFPKFEFFNLTKDLPARKLYLRDPAQAWYLAGLPGVGATVADVAEALRREIDRLGVSRVVTVGNSMGGYAALLFGRLLGADEAHAFSPQTFVDAAQRTACRDPRWEAQITRGTTSPGADPAHFDLAAFLAGGKLDAHIHYSTADELDALHAERMADVSGITLHAHEIADHDGLARHLRDTGALGEILRRAVGAGQIAG